jgi:hypothetical protein
VNADPLLDTLLVPDRYNLHPHMIWSLNIAPGVYDVVLGLGDAAYSSTYTAVVNGIRIDSGKLSRNQFVEKSIRVTVADDGTGSGKLEIEGKYGNSAESLPALCYLNVAAVLTPAPTAAPTGGDESDGIRGDVAKAEFVSKGGDASDFEKSLRAGAKEKVGSTITECTKKATAGKATGTHPSQAEMEECDTEAMVAFEEAGGDKTDFRRQKSKAATDTLSGSMETCIKAAGTAPTKADKAACETAAKEAFVQAGGLEDEFARAKRKGAARAAGGAMEMCAKRGKALALELPAESKPTDQQWKEIKKECENMARAEFALAGGTQDFDMAIAEGAVDSITETLEACIGTPSPTEANKKVCELRAKTAFEEAGGNPKAFKRRKQKAAASSLADAIEACYKGADSAGAPTTAEKSSCTAKGKEIFIKAGGRASKFDVAKRKGAKDAATEVLQACIGDFSAEVISTDTEKASLKADCRKAAKKAFEQAGGGKNSFDRMEKEGAREALMTKIEVCIEVKLAELNLSLGTKATDAQYSMANTKFRF